MMVLCVFVKLIYCIVYDCVLCYMVYLMCFAMIALCALRLMSYDLSAIWLNSCVRYDCLMRFMVDVLCLVMISNVLYGCVILLFV